MNKIVIDGEEYTDDQIKAYAEMFIKEEQCFFGCESCDYWLHHERNPCPYHLCTNIGVKHLFHLIKYICQWYENHHPITNQDKIKQMTGVSLDNMTDNEIREWLKDKYTEDK